ncbi:hypothetical protein LKO27_13050 [Tessaracoccus sp. OS52]|uniref:hypothetical protein n=1 Tax=Tessaracoccus sp. OS52 TaxID=2886691 RepID=UPI001D1209BF|nr:hypothetical protein [Tessaracoccus sp. OS52]MCC2594333.1 hypothetical protein [Tessaracoccus sp. OS52]
METKTSSIFALDYLAGSGGSLMTTGLLGALDNGRILAAIRGAGTLLGPLNLLSGSARSLMLPFLGRRRDEPSLQFRSAATAMLAQVCVFLPLLVALQLLPESWGEQALGESWEVASMALLPISVEALFGLVGSVADSGHRVALAGSRSLLLRVLVGLPRPFVVLWCGYRWGVEGAAWAMAAISVLNAALWWYSYHKLVSQLGGDPESDNES